MSSPTFVKRLGEFLSRPLSVLFRAIPFASRPRDKSYFCSASPSSADARTCLSSSNFASSPFWCIETRISQPPTNSLSTYNCGIVGQSEYSLMPTPTSQLPCAMYPTFVPLAKAVPDRSSGSSSTLKAANLFGSTPCRPKIWMVAREKPHCGVSGVPFMKRTTGAEPTALSIAWRVESERYRCAMLSIGDLTKAGLENCAVAAAGRAACRSSVDDSIDLENIVGVCVVQDSKALRALGWGKRRGEVVRIGIGAAESFVDKCRGSQRSFITIIGG